MNLSRRSALALAAACVIWSGCSNAASESASASPAPAAATPSAAPGDAKLRAALQQDLNLYLKTRAVPEHISAVSFSLSRAGNPVNMNLTAGTYEYGGGGGNVTPSSLFQIGSITKSFTAVAILHLVAAGKLSLDDTVGKWLPQYPAWKAITIRRLLDMTGGIETYDNTPAFQRDYAKDPTHFFSTAVLLSYVYPRPGQPVKFEPGWYYSNSAYILSQMIVQRASGMPFDDVMRNRIIAPQRLANTYYDSNVYPASVRNRMVAGYFASRDAINAPMASLYGRNMRDDSMSWAQGAGGVVATPEDVTHWARALFDGPLLAPKQRAGMESIVSVADGKPIASTSAKDPRGFGLGVAQLTRPDLGTFWFYEGETLGYRMVYAYFPLTRTVYAIGLNSQPDSKQDQIGSLMGTIYKTLQANNAI